MPLVDAAMRGSVGPYALQAAIAAEHCRARTAAETNWTEILRLYTLLEQVVPSPIISLNRAVAVAMADGPSAGLAFTLEVYDRVTNGRDGYPRAVFWQDVIGLSA